MKVYITALTGWAVATIGFDLIWRITNLDIIECFFMAMCIGFVAAGAFLLLTDRKEVKRGRPTYITDDETGLQFMPMKNGRVA